MEQEMHHARTFSCDAKQWYLSVQNTFDSNLHILVFQITFWIAQFSRKHRVLFSRNFELDKTGGVGLGMRLQQNVLWARWLDIVS